VSLLGDFALKLVAALLSGASLHVSAELSFLLCVCFSFINMQSGPLLALTTEIMIFEKSSPKVPPSLRDATAFCLI